VAQVSKRFQTCRIADFQIGCVCDVARRAGLETGDTAGAEACAAVLRPFNPLTEWQGGSPTRPAVASA
jgi:hypothetical protein